MIKTTLVPGAPWPEVTPPATQPKPKRKWIPKDTNSKRQQTDKKFEEWLKGNA